MEWSMRHTFLTILLVVTGSINSLSTKWADKLDSKGSDGTVRKFTHPFLQTLAMFLGEMLCLAVFKITRLQRAYAGLVSLSPPQNFSPYILMPAALCDVIATSIMYFGLTLTYVSSFQMFRGSVIIFVAILSITFLEKKMVSREWAGIASVIFGLLLVGFTDAMFIPADEMKYKNNIITGDLLIIIAQIIIAIQMVYEEKYVKDKNIDPLQAVGWEGVFGFFMIITLLTLFYWIPAPFPFDGNNPRHTIEDALDGLVQISNSPKLMFAFLGTILSIAFFNYAGISITKDISATTRMVLDSVRTLVIWLFSLIIHWQEFHFMYLAGFAILLFGMCEYNGMLPNYIHSDTEVLGTPEVVITQADRVENES